MIRLVAGTSLDRDEAAAGWCVRLAEGPLAAAEQDQFDAWLLGNPLNAAAFEDATALWDGIGAIQDSPELIRFRAEAVEALRRTNQQRWSRGLGGRWRWPAAVAACLAAVLMLGIQLLDNSARVYETGLGERRIAMLEDGSRLTLDAATRVEVRMDRDRRRIELITGRAKFDVAHDALRPLTVLARNRLTVATGTSFSVELLPRQMRVVLYEGKVEVMKHIGERADANLLAEPHSSIALAPGRELIASTVGPQVRVAEADVPRSLDWESGQLSFDGEPLALAVERINRSARNKLVIADGRIAGYRIVGTFNAGDTEAFVEGVSALHPVRVVREPGMLILNAGG